MASLLDVASLAPWTFVVGFAVGFVVGARFRISKRNGD